MSQETRIGITGLAVAGLFAIVAACSSETIAFTPAVDDAGGPSFTSGPDSGLSSVDGSPTGTQQCASNKCIAPFTTCASSVYPCDIDTSNDINNCGECGNACPPPFRGERFICNAGKCEVSGCGVDPDFGKFKLADCNGFVDDGCEVEFGTTENCNACGDKCAPGVPCVTVAPLVNQCGCPAGETNCGGSCKALVNDDTNCGACGTACDITKPAPPNAYYGCDTGTCGHLKCEPGYPGIQQWEDCDKDLQKPNSDGCEVDIYSLDNNNCGACGNKCPSGEQCFMDYFSNTPRCQCPPGQTYCLFECVDVSNDPNNCGTCGTACLGAQTVINQQPTGVNSKIACNSGTCATSCNTGFADCNNDLISDGCEVDTRSDPKNCGGCGIECDGVAGQPCINGKCATVECGGVK